MKRVTMNYNGEQVVLYECEHMGDAYYFVELMSSYLKQYMYNSVYDQENMDLSLKVEFTEDGLNIDSPY